MAGASGKLISLQFREPAATVSDQIDDLKRLKDSPHRRAPSEADLEWFRAQYSQHWPSNAPSPYLYSTAEGGLLAEWETARVEYSLKVEPGARTGEMIRMDKDDELEPESEFISLVGPEGWKQLAEYIGVAPE